MSKYTDNGGGLQEHESQWWTTSEKAIESMNAYVAYLQGAEWSLEAPVDATAAALIELPAEAFLHHRLAALHSSGIKDILDHAARLMAPILKRQIDVGNETAGLVLMILLLRDSLTCFGETTISDLHAKWFPRFSYPELSIPYNLIFEKKRFKKNKQDLLNLLRAEDSYHFLNSLPITHLVFLEWLFEEEDIHINKSLIVDKFKGSFHSTAIPADQKDAARTAQIRHELGASIHSKSDLQKSAMRRLQSRPWRAAYSARSILGSQAPALHLFSRKPKIAVCVSGQLRGYGHALQTWQRILFPTIEAQVFVDTWAQVGRSGAEPFREALPFDGINFQAAYRAICTEIGLEAFMDRYPHLFLALHTTGNVDRNQLQTAYQTEHVVLDNEFDAPFVNWDNQEKMHFKICSCIRTALNSGQEFDLVIRIRPDLPLHFFAFDWKHICLSCLGDNTIFADKKFGVQYGTILIGDQFAVGTPRAMTDYAETAIDYPSLAANGLLSAPKRLTGHTSLAYMTWLKAISVRKLPARFGALAESAKLSVNQIFTSIEADSKNRYDSFDNTLINAILADQ